jgi:hypothetical protein
VRLFSQGKMGTGKKNVPARARAAHSEARSGSTAPSQVTTVASMLEAGESGLVPLAKKPGRQV